MALAESIYMKVPVTCPTCRHTGEVEVMTVVNAGVVTCEKCGELFDFDTETPVVVKKPEDPAASAA